MAQRLAAYGAEWDANKALPIMPSTSSTAAANAAETQLMHFTGDRDALMTEVAAAERADSRGTLPILSHLLLDAKDGVLAITACDLKRTLRSECPAEVKVAGKAAFQRAPPQPDNPKSSTVVQLDDRYRCLDPSPGATTLRAIAAELNARNIPAVQGGEWSSVQVMRVLSSTTSVAAY